MIDCSERHAVMVFWRGMRQGRLTKFEALCVLSFLGVQQPAELCKEPHEVSAQQTAAAPAAFD